MERPIMPAAPDVLTARDFCAGMEGIWGDDPHKQYADWHNAVKVLDAIGASRLGVRYLDGELGASYRLPTGEIVLAAAHGGLVRPLPADSDLTHTVVLGAVATVLLENFIGDGCSMGEDADVVRLEGGKMAIPVDSEVFEAIDGRRQPGESDNDVVLRMMGRNAA